MFEKIDQLRELLEARDRNVVTMHALAGILDVTTNTIYVEYADSGDRAYVFLGPKDKLVGTRTLEADGTTVYTIRIKP